MHPRRKLAIALWIVVIVQVIDTPYAQIITLAITGAIMATLCSKLLWAYWKGSTKTEDDRPYSVIIYRIRHRWVSLSVGGTIRVPYREYWVREYDPRPYPSAHHLRKQWESNAGEWELESIERCPAAEVSYTDRL